MLLVGLCLTIVGFVSIRVLESTGVGLQHKNHLISPDAVTIYYQPSLQWQMSFDLKFKTNDTWFTWLLRKGKILESGSESRYVRSGKKKL